MQELRLVAVSEDGTYLVLATAGRGTRFTLPVDDRLRAAVRGHFSRLGQFEIEVESPLRPKEIQARIRSGETAEEIAESAGIPVERVRWFEGPVLQEREYMAQQAQRVTVRRPGESTPGQPLGETVEERLARGGVDLDETEWDSWKCDDGTWRVRLSFFEGGRPHAAEWTFDPRRRHVSPLDEVAARLTSDEWDEDALSDTVTPLVPRRPTMKIVSGDRDPVARGLPAEPAQPGPPEPLRAAGPREYLVERGRMIDPRPAFREAPEAPPPALREAARPAEAGPRHQAGHGAGQKAEQETGQEAEAAAEAEPPPAAPAEPPAGAVRAAQAPGPRAVGEQEDRTPPAEPERPAREDEAAPVDAARPGREEATAEAGDTARPEEPSAEQPRESEQAHEPQHETPHETRHETPHEQPAQDRPAEAAGEPGPDAGTPEQDRPAAPAEAGPAAAKTHEPPGGTGGETGPADTPAGRVPRAREAAEPQPAGAPEAPPAARDEPAPPKTPAAPRPAARTPAKKKPATRPTMPAAQDKPATGSPAAAAGGEPAPQRPARRRKSKAKRASVPSWDEIMFGARRPD